MVIQRALPAYSYQPRGAFIPEHRPDRIAQPLLAWFDRHRRHLPWRRTSDPYCIWVSEIMLQQTQVHRVIGYYERFLQAFPTLEALAQAPIDDVLRLWEGLGYYSRARSLHAAAQIILAEHDGRFPRSPDGMRALPGVGEYTAGAVLSIAYGVPLPAIDANAARVLARLFAIRGDVSKGEARRRVTELAAQAVPQDRPGDFNQALMDLGSDLCARSAPGCLLCPLIDLCLARAQGLQDRIPPSTSRATKQLSRTAAVVWDNHRVLVARRPPDAHWGRLWEFPNTRVENDGSPQELLAEHLAQAFGIEAEVAQQIARFPYGIMNRRIDLTVHACHLLRGQVALARHEDHRWLGPRELTDFAMPSPHRAIADMLSDPDPDPHAQTRQ